MKNSWQSFGRVFLPISLVAVVAPAFVFITRFDPNHYRSLLESVISENSGLKAGIGQLSFSKGGIMPGLQVGSFKLKKDKEQKPLFETEKITIELDALSLLGGQIVAKISSEKGTLRVSSGERVLTLRDVKLDARSAFPSGLLKWKGEGSLFNPSKPDLEWKIEMDRGKHIDFDLRFERDHALLKGDAYAGQKPPRFRFELKLDGLEIPKIFTAVAASRKSEAPFTGSLDGIMEIQGAGKNPAEIQKSLLGRGGFDLQNGVILNFNLAHFLLKRITLLPVLGEILNELLPPSFQAALNSPRTSFELIEAHFQVQGGEIQFSSVMLKNPHYLVEGEGKFDLEGNVDFKARLILLEDLSGYLIGRVRELRFFANSQGRVVIPFVYRGVWPHARPLPDLGYLAERLLGNQGMNLLEKGLKALNHLTE